MTDDEVEKRRLPTPRGSVDDDEVALERGETDVAQGVDRLGADAVRLGQALGVEELRPTSVTELASVSHDPFPSSESTLAPCVERGKPSRVWRLVPLSDVLYTSPIHRGRPAT